VGTFNPDVAKSTALIKRETPSSPGDDEVVVNILCRPINPSDIMVYSGYYPLFQPEKLPVPIGLEGMGTISEVNSSFVSCSFFTRILSCEVYS
jgi:NADPH:quinone reductase-like Zn-dependent oxidoreductase